MERKLHGYDNKIICINLINSQFGFCLKFFCHKICMVIVVDICLSAKCSKFIYVFFNRMYQCGCGWKSKTTNYLSKTNI